MNFNKYKITIAGIVLGVLFWIIEAIMDNLIFYSEGDLIHHLFFIEAHELWMRLVVIFFIEALSIYSQIIFNKVKTNPQKIEASEKKYRDLANLLPQVICEIGAQGNLTFANQNAYKVFGYTQDDFDRGLNAFQMIVPNDHERVLRNIKKILNGEDIDDIEYMALRKDGSVFPFIAYGSPIIQENKSVGLRIVLIDISDLKKIEEELRESEENYRLISENANDLIAILNSKFEHEYINEKTYQKILGYSNEDMLGKARHDIIHPADIKQAFKVLKDGFKKGEGTGELRLRHKNENYIWVETKGRTFKGSDGLLKAITVSRDITERKLSEQRLKESEEKYRLIIESISDPLHVVDAELKLIYLNPAFIEWLKTLGLNHEVIGKTPAEAFPFIGEKETKEYQEVFNSKKEIFLEASMVLNNKRIFTETKKIPILKSGKVIQIITIVRNVTESKEIEQKLKESEVKYRHLFETSPYVIGLLNGEGILIDCNDAINDILSTHIIEDVKSKNFKELLLLNGKNKHLIPTFEKLIKSIFEGVNQEAFDFRLNRAIGDHLWIHIECTLIEIEKQELIQFIMQDITERKRSEQVLQEIIGDLARINAELEQFTYVASHDLKEPLRMISSFAQLLEKRYKDKLDEDANDFIRFITEGAVRMQDLINNLLDYSKIGKPSREFEKFDLDDVLKDVIDNLRQIINETNAEIIYDSLPSIYGDKYQLLQVFQNLISNAIKFRGIDTPLIRISAKPDGKHWVFSINDNGIGVDSKDFERIFIIFKRLNITGKYEGTGIGLAICKKIVEYHRGKIWVESEVGKGSTFYFSIPKEIDIKS